MGWLIIVAIVIGVLNAIGKNSEKKEREKTAGEALSRQQAAEQYIFNSGDEEAIKQLMLMRANPATYQNQLAKAADSGNSTMRTAFAVMGGFIAADLITSSMHMSALEDALASVNADMDQALANFEETGSFEHCELDGFEIAEVDGIAADDIDMETGEEGLGGLIESLFS